jgi:hypothetical protein
MNKRDMMPLSLREMQRIHWMGRSESLILQRIGLRREEEKRNQDQSIDSGTTIRRR